MARGAVVKRISKHDPRQPLYYVVYRLGGRQKWEACGSNKKGAQRRLIEIISQINNGIYRKPVEITFADFAEKWLKSYAEARVKPATLRSYRYMLRYRLIPNFGNLTLSQISAETIQGFVSKTLTECSAKTVNHHLVLLKEILKHARRWKYIVENPAEDVSKIRLQPKEMDFLKPEEIRLLLQHSDEPYRTLFLTAILTGMRRGELFALQWGDIDWNSNLIYVRRSLFFYNKQEVAETSAERRWTFLTPKSHYSKRTVVMSPLLKEALEMHRLTAPVSPEDLVFCNKNGGPMDPENVVKREFNPALARAGLRRVRFHDLRHSYTTLLISQGENIKFIQSQLGHGSIQTTLDRYGHLLPSCQTEVGSRIDRQVFGTPSGQLTEALAC